LPLDRSVSAQSSFFLVNGVIATAITWADQHRDQTTVHLTEASGVDLAAEHRSLNRRSSRSAPQRRLSRAATRCRRPLPTARIDSCANPGPGHRSARGRATPEAAARCGRAREMELTDITERPAATVWPPLFATIAATQRQERPAVGRMDPARVHHRRLAGIRFVRLDRRHGHAFALRGRRSGVAADALGRAPAKLGVSALRALTGLGGGGGLACRSAS
jgi:hypothetical protein